MSGGISETFELSKIRAKTIDSRLFWKVLLNARQKGCVVSCNISYSENASMKEEKLNNGLVRCHAYCITRLVEIQNRENTLILRLYNPWGDLEWEGDGSDKSKKWNKIDDYIKDLIDFKDDKDGHFWYGISYNNNFPIYF